MSNLADELRVLLQRYINLSLSDVTIGAVARIEAFDKEMMVADVQPLLMYKEPEKDTYAEAFIIPDIPVQFLYAGGFYIRPEYVKGDLVWVTFATHMIEKAMSGSMDRIGENLFQAQDASVVSGIAKTNWSAPSEFSKAGLLIGHEDSEFWLQITKDQLESKAKKFIFEGDFEITGNVEVTGKISATDNIESEAEVTALSSGAAINLSTHKHTANLGAPTSPPLPG